MKTKLAGQWVLITGASSGIGAAAARAFAAEGARLLLGARRMPRLKEVAGECVKAGSPAVHCRALDVVRPESILKFFEWVKNLTLRLDVLINNAGGAKGLETVAEGRDEDWDFMINANVLGLLRVTRAALPLMTGQPGGAIINIGSVAGRTAYEGGSAYCAAKAGELKITQALRLELLGTGVRVCTVDPGLVETEFSLVRFQGDVARAKKVYEGMTPLTGQDVAEALVWVASRPAHVCIDELVIKPTDQATVYKVHRRPKA